MQLAKSGIIKLTAFIIAFQVLNMSIDSPNARLDNDHISTDPFNYIDSYVEYVAEVVLKYDNAIPESAKRHQKQWQQHKLYQVICDNIKVANNHSVYYYTLQETFFNHQNRYTYQFIKEISHPPKFSC